MTSKNNFVTFFWHFFFHSSKMNLNEFTIESLANEINNLTHENEILRGELQKLEAKEAKYQNKIEVEISNNRKRNEAKLTAYNTLYDEYQRNPTKRNKAKILNEIEKPLSSYQITD